MLDQDYQRLLGRLIETLPQSIELPESHENFFQEKGPAPFFEGDNRVAVRNRIRTQGIAIPEKWLPAFPREPKPIRIYTKDFSKTGCGFLADRQFFPGEIIRVVLATFWLRVKVRRGRRLTATCFEVGAQLQSQHDPSLQAFAEMNLA